MKKTTKTLSLVMALALVFALSSGMASAEVVGIDMGSIGTATAPAAPAAPEVFAAAPSVAAPSVSGPSVSVPGGCSHAQWNTPVYTAQADGTYLASRSCAVCGAIQNSVGTVKEEIVKKATCTESGLKSYYAVFPAEWAGRFKVMDEAIPALGHSIDPDKFVWTGDEWNHYNVCDRCGEHFNPQPHVWGEWQVLRQADSQNAGKAIQYCEVCGCNRTCEIPRRTPKTGDEAMLGLWLGLAIVSAAAASTVIAAKKRDNK